MAEEKVDGLEGLDDFGDDFGEQLDSFMENDGDEEVDSELDSFFEDLSTIDDLESEDETITSKEKKEEKSNGKSSSDDTDEGDDEPHEDDEPDDNEIYDDGDYDPSIEDENISRNENPKSEKKEKKKSILIPLSFSSVTGIVLGIISLSLLYFLPDQIENISPEKVAEIKKEPLPKPKVKKTKPKKSKIKPKIKVKTKVKAKSNRISYYVQVVSCISRECVEESSLKLKSMGYKLRVNSSSETTGISEVISTKILSEEYAARMVREINNKNPLAGHAFRKKTKRGYKVSLGLFPDLETANRVRIFLNQAFKKEISFDIIRVMQNINFQAVQITGIKSREEALRVRNKLRENDPNFQSAFVKGVIIR